MKPGNVVRHARGGLGVVEGDVAGVLFVRALRCVEPETPRDFGPRPPLASSWESEQWSRADTAACRGEDLPPTTPPAVREALTVMALRVGKQHR